MSEGEYEEPDGYGPVQLREAYVIPPSGGAGQTIAIVAVGDDPHAEADLGEYRSQFKLSACTAANGCFTKKDWQGGTSFPASSSEAAQEISLDLDMASVGCEECHIILVEVPEEAGSAGVKKIGEAQTEAITLGATEISNSYSGPDGPGSKTLDSYFIHSTIPTTVASGDYGFEFWEHPVPEKGAGYPADIASSHLVAVGGTVLAEEPAAPRGWTDTIWPRTGSGCAVEELRPGWQPAGGCSKRLVNDVSLVAEGVATYNSYLKATTPWEKVGGTSVGAPLFAGMLAHASEKVREGPTAALYKNLEEGVGTVQDVIPPAAGPNTNYNSACSNAYECTSVAGEDGNPMKGFDGPTGVGVPQGTPSLASWSAQTMPTPGHEEEEELYGVACRSASSCMAVGSVFSTQLETRAMHWDGKEWSVEATPTPSGNGGQLYSVSCAGASSCYSDGYYEASGKPRPLVLSWNGTSWSEELPSYAGYSTGELRGMACSAPSSCTAVGAGEKGSARVPLAESWNGTSWSVQVPPLPASGLTGELLSVSCTKATYCIAVGDYSTASHTATLAERWNGTSWATLSPNNGSATGANVLDGVSCWSEKLCMGVGYYGGGGSEKALAELWDGTQWSAAHTPAPSTSGSFHRLGGVSCGSATACTAAGEEGGKTVADGWNGVSWGRQAIPVGLEQEGIGLGVSCDAVTECMLVGTTWETGWDEARAGRFAE